MRAVEIPRSSPVVVVGGGIIGLALAFELGRRGTPVLVLERDRVGAGAARAAAGMLAAAGEAEHETPELVELMVESLRSYPAFVRDIEQSSGVACGLREEGTLIVALGRDDEEELLHLRRAQDRLGLASSWLSGDEARALEPHLSPRITAALLAEDDHQVDPRALLAALGAAVDALGGRVVEGARATGFETEGGRLASVVGIREREGTPFEVRCEAAVLAAGAWSATDLRWPTDPLPVRPVKGQVVRLRGPELLRRVVRGPQVYLVPRRTGELVVGATMEEVGFDAAPTAGAVMDLLWRARLLVPAVYDLELAEVDTGFRPAARDHLPILGETRVPGLYVATGHFRHGILLAPVTATLLADLLVGGRASPLLAPFRPARFAAGAPAEGRA